MTRNKSQLLPSYTAEIEEIRQNGIYPELLYKIIQKHLPNSNYNKYLHDRYMAIYEGVPIFDRQPMYEEENPINNRVNNDFFSEIVDFKTGYFAGKPISYSYNNTAESEESTGGEEAVDKASKTLTDFLTRNNMFGVDMETTRNASIYGYSGRLFYIDQTDGMERVMPIPGYETIILSNTTIAEPEFAIRYYEISDINDNKSWEVLFYDDKTVKTYRGDLMSLQLVEEKSHSFDYCPLQGIANNAECMGDAEKVLNLIDDYDKVLSDNSNEIESFVHAMLLCGVDVPDEVIHKAQKSGVMIVKQFGTTPLQEPIKWLTKDINDSFTEHHLERLESNIYRFSKTPNMADEAFGTASGIALKFRLHGLETKCGILEAQYMNAAQHMWRVLCSAWAKKGIRVDPLQISMMCTRNFPVDEESEARTIQAYIAAGLPKRYAYSRLPEVDDVEWIMDMIKQEQEETAEMYPELIERETADEDNTEQDNGGKNNGLQKERQEKG
jgi:SPP1 family phage portal protein